MCIIGENIPRVLLIGNPDVGVHPEAAIFAEVGRLINQGRILSIGQRRLAHELWGQPGFGSPINHGICG